MEEARNLSLINNGRKGCLILSTYALRIPKLFKTEAADQKGALKPWSRGPRAERSDINGEPWAPATLGIVPASFHM